MFANKFLFHWPVTIEKKSSKFALSCKKTNIYATAQDFYLLKLCIFNTVHIVAEFGAMVKIVITRRPVQVRYLVSLVT